jgi:adenosylcobinamide kinase/adenosylcobinamide-phosphate guanylyltransferase
MTNNFLDRLFQKNLKTVFVIGGANSGKSEIAEKLSILLSERIESNSKLYYVATAPLDWIRSDKEFETKVELHRMRRKDMFELIETGEDARDLINFLNEDRYSLVDSVSTWLGLLNNDFQLQTDLVDVLKTRSKFTVLVSDEVGLSIHAENETANSYRENLGKLNQRISAVSDLTLLVVAGKTLILEDLFVAESN